MVTLNYMSPKRQDRVVLCAVAGLRLPVHDVSIASKIAASIEANVVYCLHVYLNPLVCAGSDIAIGFCATGSEVVRSRRLSSQYWFLSTHTNKLVGVMWQVLHGQKAVQ